MTKSERCPEQIQPSLSLEVGKADATVQRAVLVSFKEKLDYVVLLCKQHPCDQRDAYGDEGDILGFDFLTMQPGVDCVESGTGAATAGFAHRIEQMVDYRPAIVKKRLKGIQFDIHKADDCALNHQDLASTFLRFQPADQGSWPIVAAGNNSEWQTN